MALSARAADAPPHFEPGAAEASAPEHLARTRLRPLAGLPGWAEENHAAALMAFRDGCGVAREAHWREVCRRAKSQATLDEASARVFFENNFSAEAASPAGLLTAYFAPEYPAQDTPDEIFSAPVRPRPGGGAAVGPPRAEIETDADETAPGAPEAPRAFMKPEDLFFLQIQGSGTLVFPDGRRVNAVYSGDNGRPFTAIARPMAARGLLPANGVSGDAIRGWLAAHRGPEADAIMDLDARYIYFDLVPYDGKEPAGAAGVPLTAGRALAVDPAYHGYGALYWVDASAPTLAGAARTYRRLALALDTGAAIRGERRADLYLGRGDAAGQEAGRVRHVLSLIRLIPTPPPATALPALKPPLRPDETTPSPRGAPAVVGGDRDGPPRR